MTQVTKKQDYAQRVIGFAKYSAKVSEELGAGLLAFVPNGLEQTYDIGLKRLPVLGKVFRHRWVEQVVKLCCGVTIGQGLASDIGRFIFWPVGFCIGALMGTGAIADRAIPVYQGQIRKFLYKLSGFTVGGALVAGLGTWLAIDWIPGIQRHSVLQTELTAMLIGASLGVLAYFMYVVALLFVMSNQSQTFSHNIAQAKGLGIKLKEFARQSVKGRILIYAQDIIQQMNGPEAQPHLTEFFEKKYEVIAQATNMKIERHFNYLTERACHGDNQALARLKILSHRKGDLDKLLDRVFNARAVASIKDAVDTHFDRWHYEFLKS